MENVTSNAFETPVDLTTKPSAMSNTEPTASKSPQSLTFETKKALNMVSRDTASPFDASAASKAETDHHDKATSFESNKGTIEHEVNHDRVHSSSATAHEQGASVEEKMNSNPGPTLSNAYSKNLPHNVSASKSPEMGVPASPKRTLSAPTPVASKATHVVRNRENIKPAANNKENLKKGAVIQTKNSKNPETNSAHYNNESDKKRYSELQAKCRARSITPYGSSAVLARRLAEAESRENKREKEREKDFALQHEKQEKLFAKERSEHEKNQKESAKGKGEHEKGEFAKEEAHDKTSDAIPPSQPATSQSSQASDSRPPKNKPHLEPAIWGGKGASRQQDIPSSICNPTTGITISPSAKPFIPLNVRFQQNDIHEKSDIEAVKPWGAPEARSQKNGTLTKPENIKPTRTFASQDVRLDPDYMLSHTGAARNRRPSNNNQSVVAPKPALTATHTAETISSAKKLPHEQKLASTDLTKTARAASAAMPANVVFVKTDREMDKINFLHKHTWEIQQDCSRWGIVTRGGRRIMVTRFLNLHLKNLQAEFIQTRDTLAKNPEAVPDLLLRKDILWYRLECFEEHRRNQIGLAGEGSRQASYVAAKECKYASPRHARIMGDKLAELIAREKQLEQENAKDLYVKSVDVSKEMDDGFKMEQW